MGLTAATGEPVLCICISAAKILSVTNVKVFDYRVSIPYESSNTIVEVIILRPQQEYIFKKKDFICYSSQ